MDVKSGPPQPFRLYGGVRSGRRPRSPLRPATPPGSSPYSLSAARRLHCRLHPLHPSERRGPSPRSPSRAAAESREGLALNQGRRGVRPRGLPGEAGLAGVRCAPGPAATATPWLRQKVKGPAGGRPEGPAREERARKARGGAAEGAGGAATSACPHPQPPSPPGVVAAPTGRTLGSRSSCGSAPLTDGG